MGLVPSLINRSADPKLDDQGWRVIEFKKGIQRPIGTGMLLRYPESEDTV